MRKIDKLHQATLTQYSKRYDNYKTKNRDIALLGESGIYIKNSAVVKKCSILFKEKIKKDLERLGL